MSYDPDEAPDSEQTENDDLPTLKPDELLSALIDGTPGAVRRAPQERMVHLVHDAINADEHIAVEAGTGTGKSFGYTVGAVATGKRVIISTATKQLGEQLTGKDVPAVARAAASLGRDLEIALLKGRANYACLSKVDDVLRAAGMDTLDVEVSDDTPNETGKQVQAVLDWVKHTDTGDRSEAPAVSEKVWSQFSTDSASCVGARECPMGDVCFAEVAKQKASHADIAVINHTLLANYMALHLEGRETALAKFDVLVADEAHELEPAISRAWTITVDPRRLERTFGAAKRIEDVNALLATGGAAVDSLSEMLARLPEGELRELPEEIVATLRDLEAKFGQLANKAKKAADDQTDQTARTGWIMLANRLNAAAKLVKQAVELDRNAYVQWAEPQRDGTVLLSAAPLSIAPMFPIGIAGWKVVLASATMTVGGKFEPLTNALGIDAPGTDVGSPFDYPRQAMVYIPSPDGFPIPAGATREAHTEAVLDTMTRLIGAAGGRTLGLFTSVKAAQNAAEVLRARFPHLTILGHGDAPMGQLVEQFRDDETSVLLGTRGLWQGLSIDGPSLSCVVIDKIPFPMMNDPLMQARTRKVNEAGGRGFDEVQVASAAITLAQGAGRLIRTAEDKGVIAVLDPRLWTKYYGAVLRRSLPNARVWKDLEPVEEALARLVGNVDTQARAA